MKKRSVNWELNGVSGIKSMIALQSSIIVNAHKINAGIVPSFKPAEGQLDDFYFIHREEPEEVLQVILGLLKERIPNRFGFDPIDDIQVLTPMHKGTVGAGNLNAELQNELNPSGEDVTRWGRSFRVTVLEILS
jgi:exodeoxyribonuclease V alpha subunit